MAVKFSPSHWLWPYPGGRLAYVFTVLLCVERGAGGRFCWCGVLAESGTAIGWGRRWGFYVAGSFVAFAPDRDSARHGDSFRTVRASLGASGRSLPFLTLAILCFTAWPEEFLFRGLLQNMLARSAKSEMAGWWTASVVFGFSHITNLGFPNWRYVILASIAGLFYGWTWRKTGSIFASAIVHALVDVIWHFLFRTL